MLGFQRQAVAFLNFHSVGIELVRLHIVGGIDLHARFGGQLASRGDVEIVYPVHLNPNVQVPVKKLLTNVDHITLLSPLDYLPLVHLMKHAKLILTDSGGIQEEAPAFGIPTLVLRDVTERPEGVEAGTLKLVGTVTRRIVEEAGRLLDDSSEYEKMAKAANPYGDGHASEKIVQALTS